MAKLDPIQSIRKKLMDSLGENSDEYLRIIRNWFKLKGSREELERDLNAIMTPHEKHLHDQLLLHILHKCADKPTVKKEKYQPNRRYRSIRKGFEPTDPTLYVVSERKEVNCNVPPFMIHERLLPDNSLTLARLIYSSWEHGLEGAQSKAAEFLLVATKNFLKNILTAVITRRKNYKCGQNGFIHDIGCAMPRPYLQNVMKKKSDQFHSLKFDGVLNNEIVKPAERPTADDLEEESVFRLAAASCEQEIRRISLDDLLITLEIHPNLIGSNFVRVVNKERIYARRCHPVNEC